MKYRKKLIEVMAFRLSVDEPPDWSYRFYINPSNFEQGSWIVYEPDNDFLYSVPHEIFIATYEAVE